MNRKNLLRHPAVLSAAAAMLAAAGAFAVWIVLLGPAPLGVGLEFSTTVVNREGRLCVQIGVLGHPAHGVDAGEKRRKLDGPAQCALRVFPPVEVRQCGVYLLIR